MKKVIVFVVMCVLLCSCASSAILKTNANLMKLNTGMSQDEAVTIMGTPTLSERYEAADGNQVSILYYRTERKKTTVLSAKDECTPVVFMNGKLVGWGDRLTAADINLLKVKTK
jgi:hypothetical protein